MRAASRTRPCGRPTSAGLRHRLFLRHVVQSSGPMHTLAPLLPRARPGALRDLRLRLWPEPTTARSGAGASPLVTASPISRRLSAVEAAQADPCRRHRRAGRPHRPHRIWPHRGRRSGRHRCRRCGSAIRHPGCRIHRLCDRRPHLSCPTSEPFYGERPVRLPEPSWCWGREPAPPGAPTRRAKACRPGATVFCSSKPRSKLTPDLLASWLRILEAVPSSVLWLLANALSVEPSLRREVLRRGGDLERLVFARTIGYSLHLVPRRPRRPGAGHAGLQWRVPPPRPALGRRAGADRTRPAWAGAAQRQPAAGAGLPELIAADRRRLRGSGHRAGPRAADGWPGSGPDCWPSAGPRRRSTPPASARHLERAYRAMRARFDAGPGRRRPSRSAT